MAPKKLSDSEKQDIVSLYREPAETTTTLSERFGVSNSTISRILKSALSREEYNALVQQKRAKGSSASPNSTTTSQTSQLSSGTTDSGKPMPITKSAKSSQAAVDDSDVTAASETAIADQIADQAEPFDLTDQNEEEARRSRKRSSTKPVTKSDKIRAQAEQAVAEKIGQQLQLLDASFRDEAPLAVAEATDSPVLDTPQSYAADDLDDDDDDDFDDELEDDLDDIDDLDDDFDDEDEDEDEDDEFDEDILDSTAASNRVIIEILPFEDAELPRTCYLVVDRFAELITRPLREFGHLGQIPEAEIQEMTLPVFDNHRVARRFSRRNQRVIKVPDGTMLEKTSDYLQAKGITRLLIDGQIYALD
ncbi:MAG: hypothetical protein ACTS2F_11180 [Thainema sp.]